MKSKKLMSTVLTASIIASTSLNVLANEISSFKDIPNDWSRVAIESAIKNDLLTGKTNDRIAPNEKLTRAEIATIITRAFGADEKTDISNYIDVNSFEWYYEQMQRAVEMGILKGTGNKLNPHEVVTREEAATILSRAFCLEPEHTKDTMNTFLDGRAVSKWAENAVAAMIEKQYMNGFKHKLDPHGDITRAEFAQLMYKMVEAYPHTSNVIKSTYNGNVILTQSEASLEGAVIHGDLVLGDGIKNGHIELSNTLIEGRLLIRGNATVTVKQNTAIREILVVESSKEVKVDVEKGSKVDKITCKAPTKISGEGEVREVEVNSDYVVVDTFKTKVMVAKQIKNTRCNGKNIEGGENIVLDKIDEKQSYTRHSSKKSNSSIKEEPTTPNIKKPKHISTTSENILSLDLKDVSQEFIEALIDNQTVVELIRQEENEDVKKVVLKPIKSGIYDISNIALIPGEQYSVYIKTLKYETVELNFTAYEDDFEIEERDGDPILVNYKGDAEVVAVPNGIQAVDEYSFSGKEKVKTVIIPKSVTFVHSSSFQDCKSFENFKVVDTNEVYEVIDGVLYYKNQPHFLVLLPSGRTGVYEVPSSVEKIEEGAFYSTGITELIIPPSVKSIGEGAVDFCFNLKNINVQKENMNYASEKGILYNHDKTTIIMVPPGISGEYVIPETVTRVAPFSFYSCSKLSSIKLSDHLTAIPVGLFAGCSGLQKITLTEELETIEERAFVGCSSLTEITIPKKVSHLGDYAFTQCESLKSINVDKMNKSYESKEGVVFNKDEQALIAYPIGVKGDYSVPEGTKVIHDGAFFTAFDIGTITIPDSVQKIGSVSFGMNGMWPKNLKIKASNHSYAKQYAEKLGITLEKSASEEDSSKDQLVTLEGITYLSRDNGETAIIKSVENTKSTIKLPECIDFLGHQAQVVKIDDKAFENCTLVKHVYISRNIENIGDLVFKGCNVTLHGLQDSVAQKYAKKMGIPFILESDDTQKTLYATAPVKGYNYDAKIKVIVGADHTIKCVEDNGTEPNDNQAWWTKALNMLNRYVGKDVSDLETIDGISGATFSSNAIKKAVKEAIGEKEISKEEILAPKFTIQDNKWVIPCIKDQEVQINVLKEKDLEVYYTVDGTEPTIESLPLIANKIKVKSDFKNYPRGQKVEIKAVAIKNGKVSTVTSKTLIFASAYQKGAYKSGQYSVQNDEIKVQLTIDEPYYDGVGYITAISSRTTNSEVEELIGDVLYAQEVDESLKNKEYSIQAQKVLDTIKLALNKAMRVSQPSIIVTPDKKDYENKSEIKVTLECTTPEATIYYTVDNSNKLSSNTLSNPATDYEKRTKYTEPFYVNIEHLLGGKLYIRAVAIKEENYDSEIARKDLDFLKDIKNNAFSVGEEQFSKFEEAVEAINALDQGGTIILNDDIELTGNTVLPIKPCTLQSAEGKRYKIKGPILNAESDLIFDNVDYAVSRIYANGHDLTIGERVKTAWSWSGYDLYAGGEKDISGSGKITVASGSFNVYGSGKGSTLLTGNPVITIQKTAEAKVAGAAVNAQVRGDVKVNIIGDKVKFKEFIGEQNKGDIKGDLTLIIKDNPIITDSATYRSSVNKNSFGKLNLEGSTITATLFKGFEEITSQGEETDEVELEETKEEVMTNKEKKIDEVELEEAKEEIMTNKEKEIDEVELEETKEEVMTNKEKEIDEVELEEAKEEVISNKGEETDEVELEQAKKVIVINKEEKSEKIDLEEIV